MDETKFDIKQVYLDNVNGRPSMYHIGESGVESIEIFSLSIRNREDDNDGVYVKILKSGDGECIFAPMNRVRMLVCNA